MHDNFTAHGNIINNVIAENSINGHFNIQNLTLGGNTVTITGTLSVSQTLDAGKATTINTENGEVYLLATDVTNACNFLTDHPVSFIGNGFIYERLFDAASGVAEPYYNVALPLTGTRTLSTLFKGTGQRFQNGGTSTSSAYMYNPTLTDNQGWIYCQETDAIQAGTGFRMKFAGVGGSTVPLKILGNPFTDEPGINLNYCPSSCGYGTEENGWNLVGNPYNCALSFANVVSNGVEPFVYYFNTATRQYGMAGFDNSISTRGATSTVANGQSFFVRANSAGANLYFKNSDRVNSFAPVTPRAAPENLLRITLKSGPETDETLIQFSPDAAPAYEQGTDAQKMFNQNLNLYTRSNNGKNLVLNRTNIPAGRTSLALAFSGASTGINVLSFEGAGALNNIGLMLCDRYTGETLVLSEGSQYAFSVSTDPASISPDRFTLQASTSVLGLTRLSKTVFELYPNPSTGLFNISGTETGRVKVINTVGELVSETTLGEGGSRTLNIAGQPAGMYRVTLQTAQGSQSRLVVKQ